MVLIYSRNILYILELNPKKKKKRKIQKCQLRQMLDGRMKQ